MTTGELITKLQEFRPGSEVHITEGKLVVIASMGKVRQLSASDDDLGRGTGCRAIVIEIP